jgi:hypothetical protein
LLLYHLLPTSLSFWAKVASAIATFVIALSRALDFGGRWRWHIQMRNACRALEDRVNALDVLPDADRPTAAKKVFDDTRRWLQCLRSVSPVPATFAVARSQGTT